MDKLQMLDVFDLFGGRDDPDEMHHPPPIIVELKDLKLNRAEWVNSDVCASPNCGETFARQLSLRRHHCRMCGLSFCESCSPCLAKTQILSPDAYRICSACYIERYKWIKERIEAEERGDMSPVLRVEDLAPKKKNDHLTRLARTTKLGAMLLPVLHRYRSAFNQAQRATKDDPVNGFKRRLEMMDIQHEKEAPYIKQILVDMGGLYNKGAQLAATQQLILPPKLVEELKSCFEDMPPRKWSAMKPAITSELGQGSCRRGEQVMVGAFKSFNEKPLAAASIGQVHEARLVSGERVVVKILYPEIRANMNADLATMKTALQWIITILGLREMEGMINTFYDELADNFPRELDFRIEIAHMEYGKKKLERYAPGIVVPTVFHHLSGKAILTQSYMEGETLNRIGSNRDPTRMEQAKRGLNMIIDALGEQIFQDGFFHADPHPGNIMIQEDGRPVLLDWGQCMKLTRAQRRRLCQMVIMLRSRCVELIITGLNNSGFKFSLHEKKTAAAIIFFFFDSAIKGKFAKDIEEFGNNFRSQPGKLTLPTAMPREVIFFARVMQCLRRDCEVLDLDISAIDRWQPVARRELRNMVYADPIPRSPSSGTMLFTPARVQTHYSFEENPSSDQTGTGSVQDNISNSAPPGSATTVTDDQSNGNPGGTTGHLNVPENQSPGRPRSPSSGTMRPFSRKIPSRGNLGRLFSSGPWERENSGLGTAAGEEGNTPGREATNTSSEKKEERGKKKKEEEEDEDDTSSWSPSRLLLLVDTTHFDVYSDMVTWAQAHPETCDMGMRAAVKLRKLTPHWLQAALSLYFSTPLGPSCVFLLATFLSLYGLVSLIWSWPRLFIFCILLPCLVWPFIHARRHKQAKKKKHHYHRVRQVLHKDGGPTLFNGQSGTGATAKNNWTKKPTSPNAKPKRNSRKFHKD